MGLKTKTIASSVLRKTCPLTKACGGPLKTAATVLVEPPKATVEQGPIPLEPQKAPSHPAKIEPFAALGVAVSVTGVFAGKLNEQVGGQLIPAGTLVTVPVPLPGFGLST